MIPKTDLRNSWKAARSSLPLERREEAEKELFFSLQEKLLGKKVLSFASFGSEINTSFLNVWLSSQKTLFLPRIEGSNLEIYQVENPLSDLIPSSLGPYEPNPLRCKKIPFQWIEIVLVPALAFDASLYRLGYGKGHYDRLLSKLSCPTLGVGFREQKTSALPKDPWDIPLQSLLLF